MVANKDMQFFYGEFKNEQKKDKKFFDLKGWGLEPQIFNNFPKDDEIKSKEASKRDRTLP